MSGTPKAARRRSGNVLLFVTVGLFAMIGLVAFSTETGQVWAAKGQLQATADSAALAGAGSLLINNGKATDPSAALAAAQTYGAQHAVMGTTIQILPSDVQTGRWDLAARTFTPLPGSTDPSQVRAVRVLARRDDVQNGPLPTFLGRVLGVDSIPVSADAIGYVGFAGFLPPGSVELPIAIDCCAIAGNVPGSECQDDYCQTIGTNPPNPCPLNRDPSRTVSCLEFHSNPEQNACWTQFESESPSVNTRDVEEVIEEGNSRPAGDAPIYVDNGTKTPIIDLIRDRFEGHGDFAGDPAGSDTDGDGTVDSWVVALPIIECQNPGDQCATNSAAKIVGVTCFDIQEVLVTSEKIIKGEFLCDTDPRFQQCDTGNFGPGGVIDAGIDARAAVLVR